MSRKIGTHDGMFHCDESLACYLLRLLPQYKDAEIVRSRKDEVLNECDIVVDVGRIYDHEKKRYDHHQATFKATLSTIFPMKTFGDIRLSSAGLVYAHYGHEIIATQLNWAPKDEKTDKIFDIVYENFIREIDAIDNGVNMVEDTTLQRYTINTGLSSRVSHLNPSWNEESNDQILYQQFLKAVNMTGTEFLDRVNYYGKTWMPARETVQRSFDTRDEVDPSGRIIILPQFVPWINHLLDIEAELGIEGEILYGIFEGSDSWRIRALPTVKDGFNLRLPLPKEWRGLVNEELSAISGVEGCVFAHASGFIGGNKTREGAIEMARVALKQAINSGQIP